MCLEKPDKAHFVEILLLPKVDVPKEKKEHNKERMKC